MNLRGNSMQHISQIGQATAPRIMEGRTLDFSGILNSYMAGSMYADKQEEAEQRRIFEEEQAWQRRRNEELARTLRGNI